MLKPPDERGDAASTDWLTLAPPRPAQEVTVLDLPDAGEFTRLADRQALRSKRTGEAQSALVIEVLFYAPCDEALQLRLLAECARRLRSRVRATDTLARWQATHFGVLLPRCNPQQAEAVLKRLTAFAGGDYRLGRRLLAVHLQGGVLGRGGAHSP